MTIGSLASRSTASKAKKSLELRASGMQSLFWRMQKADPSSRNLLGVSGFRISGSLDPTLLKNAFESVVASEPSLRTVFLERDGEPFQRILPYMPLDWEHVKEASTHRFSDIAEMREGFREFLSRHIDMEHGPLLRVRLIRLGGEEHLLQLAVHHAVSDGTSITAMLEGVSARYNALLDGRESKTEDLAIPDLRFAERERQWLSEDAGVESLRHGVRRLDKGGLSHPWPSWRGAPEPSSRVGVRPGFLEMEMDSALSAGIDAYAKKHGHSRFRVMLGAYFMALQRMLPGRPVTVGVVMDIRRFLDEKPSTGCLINMLPVTMDGGSNGRIRTVRLTGDHFTCLEDDLKSNARKIDAVIRGIFNRANPPG